MATHKAMKTSFFIFFLALAPFLIQAQSDLGTALGKGDIAGISAHLGDKVELTIGSREEVLAKSAVQVRLREFYASHVPKGFKMMHAGNSKGNDSNYQIGELATDKGAYRVYLYFSQQASGRVVTELRFEQ
jgi:hypothetical protein